jgi:hypothetical protein
VPGLSASAVVEAGMTRLLSAIASRKRATQGASVTSRDDASPEPELLTDAQLVVHWQLSRGTLANQRSQGRGPAYLKLAGRVRYRRSGW